MAPTLTFGSGTHHQFASSLRQTAELPAKYGFLPKAQQAFSLMDSQLQVLTEEAQSDNPLDQRRVTSGMACSAQDVLQKARLWERLTWCDVQHWRKVDVVSQPTTAAPTTLRVALRLILAPKGEVTPQPSTLNSEATFLFLTWSHRWSVFPKKCVFAGDEWQRWEEQNVATSTNQTLCEGSGWWCHL